MLHPHCVRQPAGADGAAEAASHGHGVHGGGGLGSHAQVVARRAARGVGGPSNGAEPLVTAEPVLLERARVQKVERTSAAAGLACT